MPRKPTALANTLETVKRCASVVRRIIGVPDYDRYLVHMTTHHPDVIPMTPREFERVRLNDRYSQPGSRCC
jgi:uncharacterized short protein YbdD (DUF466 family)